MESRPTASLRARIVGITLVATAAVTALLLITTGVLLRRQFFGETGRTGESVAVLMSHALAAPLSRHSADEVSDVLAGLFQLEEALFAAVTLPDGSLYSEMGDLPAQLSPLRGAEETSLERRQGALVIHTPVRDECRRLVGVLHVGYSIVPMSRLLARGLFIIFLAGALLSVLAGVVADARARRLMDPLLQLSKALRQFSRGQTPSKLHAPYSDEVGRAVGAFNDLAEHLLRLQQSIDRERSELEKIVRERTDELRKKNRALAIRNDQILEASRLKSDFLANMSHELRTPLNAILALSELLRDEVTGPLSNDEQRRQAGMIHQSGESLLRLINDVLDLSKIEAGRLEICYEETNLFTLLKESAEELRPLAARKGLEIRLKLEPAPPLWVDPDRLHQVIVNLVGNAIKFTDRGYVEVKCQIEAQRDWFTVIISDTGVGIAPQDHERIFDEFRQLEGSATRRHGGTGLGLAISRRLARLMGGNITLRSDLGHGSSFTFEIPAYREKPSAAPEPADAVPDLSASTGPPAFPEMEEPATIAIVDSVNREMAPAGGRIPCLLVIDDDPVAREAVLAGLSRRDYEVRTAASGQEALEEVARVRPDLIVLELNMPGMSGFEFLDRLTQGGGQSQIPTLVNTGRDLTREEWRSLEGRVERIFLKSDGGVHILCDEIQRLLDMLREGESEAGWKMERAA